MSNPFVDIPGYSLRRAAHAMMSELASRLSAVELRVSDASVLLLVGASPNITASEIGRILDIERANMVPVLNRLEEAGLLDRQPLDRKSLGILLTAEGRERLEQVRGIIAEFEQDLMERVPEEHRAHLLPALNALWQ